MNKIILFIKQHPLLFIGTIIVSVVSLAAIFAPFISSYDPLEINYADKFLPPSKEHIFGTDSFGRDVFSRMLYGARVSLWVGVFSVGISSCIGVTLGLISGYFSSLVDSIIMRFVDIMLCFPSFFLILTVVAFLEQSLFHIMVIIGLTSWMGITRLVRAETLSLKEREFVLASKLSGSSSFYILFRHILPNAISPVIVYATLGVAGAILIESSLSFLGIGVEYPQPSWGNILLESKRTIQFTWWLSFFPGMAILITVLGYYLLGEGLRDFFDPKRYNK